MTPPVAMSARMAQYLAKLSPVPTFPEYTGPYKVGSVDVEIPIDDIDSPSPAPDNAFDIPTIQFRVFYPAVDESNEKRVWWLPNPQRHHISAYTRFVGVGSTVAEYLSFLPRHFNYTTIPAHRNAKMRQPETDDKRWPTMIFSHGLGGTRNSYSYIAGSLASHGIVVFCPEHRDGSAVATFIRVPGQQHQPFWAGARRVVPYQVISHEVSDETCELREEQLRIRLWELGLAHNAILAIDRGIEMRNLNPSANGLRQFAGRLNVHEPGSIIFAGHSFGAATVTQFLKTTYYADNDGVANMEQPLFTPAKGSEIRRQITARTVTMLFDMWCMPLVGPNIEALFNLPLPMYDDVPDAAGGQALLAVESEAFVKWRENLDVKARLLSPNPREKTVTASMFQRPSGIRQSEPNFFCVMGSAHISQSDFGVLFPWLTKRIYDATAPERALRLNLRAQLQVLRNNGVPVARTFVGDLVDGSRVDKLGMVKKEGHETSAPDGVNDDTAIFDRSGDDAIDSWRWIDTIGLGDTVENTDEEESFTPATEEEEKSEPVVIVRAGPDRQVSVEKEVALAVAHSVSVQPVLLAN